MDLRDHRPTFSTRLHRHKGDGPPITPTKLNFHYIQILSHLPTNSHSYSKNLPKVCSMNTNNTNPTHVPTGFHSLPAELHIMILQFCHSARDIRSLIRASPVALSCYVSSRKHILPKFLEMLKARLGNGEFGHHFLFAVRLRLIRQSRDRWTTAEYEEKLKSLWASGRVIKAEQSLAWLCAAEALIVEVGAFISEFHQEARVDAQAVAEEINRRLDSLRRVLEPPAQMPRRELCRFQEAAFWFEGYC